MQGSYVFAVPLGGFQGLGGPILLRGGDHHRRLAGGSSGGGTATHSAPPCEDNDTAYQIEEDKENVTCAEDAAHACQIDLGILLCPQTCGYCSPFEYEKLKTFGKPQITLLPSVLYQTRLKEAECHGFAAMVQQQNYNPVLTLLPALDGKKNGHSVPLMP